MPLESLVKAQSDVSYVDGLSRCVIFDQPLYTIILLLSLWLCFVRGHAVELLNLQACQGIGTDLWFGQFKSIVKKRQNNMTIVEVCCDYVHARHKARNESRSGYVVVASMTDSRIVGEYCSFYGNKRKR